MERKRGIEKGESRRGTTTLEGKKGRRATIRKSTRRTWASATPGEKLEKKIKWQNSEPKGIKVGPKGPAFQNLLL